MKLPNADSAFIPQEKLTHYLLSKAHPVGRAKATFFRAFGYNESNVESLEASLLELARANEVKQVIESDRGRIVHLRTVWISEPNEPGPRFVTAYPA